MANKNIFNSTNNSVGPEADIINDAGGVAYKRSDKQALAQYVTTGTIQNTFYATAEVQLEKILELCKNVPTHFIAQAAIYARENGYMKDTPALLCAVLAVRDVPHLKAIFNQVIDNGKMLRNFVQIVRSGAVGRQSFGTAIKKLIQRWFDSRRDDQLFRDSIGNDPSLADVIKMVHPNPKTSTREALFGYIIGKKIVSTKKEMEKVSGRTTTVLLKDLPEIVQVFENYKTAVLAGRDGGEIPNVPFQMLTALNLGEKEWEKIAQHAPWTMTRMNLNTFARHGVLNNKELVKTIADRLANADEVKKAKAFPYQILNAYKNIGSDIPEKIKNALQDALEVATENVPKFEVEGIHVLVDTSGSMGSSVTGYRGTATSSVRCVDVAGLMAACVLRNNEDADVILFDTEVHKVNFNSRDSVMTNSQKFARNGGGTDCSCAVKSLNDRKAKGDLIILVSDNESWLQYSGRGYYSSNGTGLQTEWKIYKKRNPNAKLVLIDIQPGDNTQAKESKDVLNIGGVSDTIWEVVAAFASDKLGGDHWVGEIEKIAVNLPTETSPVVAAKSGANKAIKKNKK